MKAINFNEIRVKDIEGNEQEVSVSKDLGNTMYMRGEDIEECELGKTIYHSEEAVELTDKQVAMVKKYLNRYSYLIRSSIIAMMP